MHYVQEPGLAKRLQAAPPCINRRINRRDLFAHKLLKTNNNQTRALQGCGDLAIFRCALASGFRQTNRRWTDGPMTPCRWTDGGMPVDQWTNGPMAPGFSRWTDGPMDPCPLDDWTVIQPAG